ncbi:hypothetical protein G7Z17_g613 [Cylindrodendrum hubeiense]|uniref:Major facilitator superfamily (MFS) profile domain-containing protein n=1 Tax=Cylindrodendrum hubeiense TaxID=595255 RepID=A0A9P5HMN2_9HYPO|nr:hypothetical protein G7Z17_g613 [Cylindrodendrum hubeiense]
MAEEVIPSDQSVSEGVLGDVQFSPEDEKRVLRKIDRVVLPLMCVVYFFQYLDKQAVGYAAIFGLQEDLHLTSDEYSWVVSIFYLGQLTSEYVFIYLMSRMQISRFVGIMIMVWGIVAGCLATPNNFGGFAAVRFILGACEGAVSPAFVIITSTWYKRKEHPIRTAAWVSCNGLASIIAPLIMYGVGYADDTALTNWRVMFLICGGATVACGLVFILLMPQSPETAWFLNDAEKKIARQRLLIDGQSNEKKVFNKSQGLEALQDPFCWMAVSFAFLGTFASPVLKFASLVINGFGWSKFNTMLVGLPSGVFQITFIWITVIGIRVTKIPRCYWGMAVTVLPLVGNIGVASIPASSKWGVVIFTWLASTISPVMVVSLSLMASNIKGNTKKAAVSNAYFILYGVAAVIAPQLWQKRDAPRYIKGIGADIACFGLIMALFMLYRVLAVRENKRRDSEGLAAEQTSTSEVADITDRQDKSFRYVS